MVIRRSKSDDYIGPSTGVLKWVNKFCRFILFPFIHPLFFVMILTVVGGSLVAVHHFCGVAYKDIPMWIVDYNVKYFNDIAEKYDIDFISKLTGKYNSLINKVDDTSQKVEDAVKNVGVVADKNGEYVKTEVVYENPISVNRRAFKKAQDVPVDVKATIERKPSTLTINNDAKAVEIKTEKDVFEFRHDYTLGLTYIKEPRVVKGEISVVNANEIRVNNELMFLYGIYVQPASDKGIDAALYLQNLVEGKEAECRIVAFTANAELTAICVIDGYSINHKMVDMGYSQNISLR